MICSCRAGFEGQEYYTTTTIAVFQSLLYL